MAGPVLTSLKNPKVAAVARLKKRSFREEDGRFLVEGARAVSEALASPGRLESLFVSDDLDELALRAREQGVEVNVVSEDVAAKITSTVTPQGIVGVATFLDVALASLPRDGCVCVLHEVRDPGNAGTVLRSADAAGAAGIVFTETSVDVYNPKTVRASAGSVFHLPIVREVQTPEAIAHLEGRGFRVLAMSADGQEDLFHADLAGPVAFVFGNEARGLSPEILALVAETVRVPHAGPAESLNLAAAATVCLFERMRRTRGGAGAGEDTLGSIVAGAAHDIRSPLTAMKGFGFALEKRWDSMTDEQRQLMLQGIVHDVDRMDTITRQLVDAARTLEGTLEPFPERMHVGTLVLELAEQQTRDPEHPKVEWAGGVDEVLVDPVRLKTTLLAFFESLVWWAHDGPIRVEALLAEGKLHVSCTRSGSELSPDRAEALFIPRKPGSGAGSKIGMFVSRSVAEAMGGRAWADVSDDRLSFHVELPVGEVDEQV